MKQLFILLFLSIGLWAESSGLYLQGNVGSTSLTEHSYKTDTGYNGSLAVGYQLNALRFEVEITESKSKINNFTSATDYTSTGDVEMQNRLINIYYSFYNQTDLTSSFGLGVGTTDFNFKDVEILNSAVADKSVSNLLTYQLSCAVGYMATKNLTYDFRYRYISTQSDENIKIDSSEVGTHIFSLGLRYMF